MLREIVSDDLHIIILQLEQALYNHRHWYSALVRTLICGLPPDAHDMCEDPSRECRFGQWYYKDAPEILKDHPGFKAIGSSHYEMHQLAKHLLQRSEAQNAISTDEYDHFANILERMVIEVLALKREFEGILNNQDPLTHVINRLSMLPILREQHELCKRSSLTCCIAMMDLDNFKETNDRYGHTLGDKMLIESTHLVAQNLRPYDKIFRYGGEEFLICLPNTDLASATALIERIRKGIESYPFKRENNQILQITASFGVVLLDPKLTVEESIDRADKALYAAKSSGKNRVQTI